MIFGLDNVDAHQHSFMHFGAIRPKCHASSEIGAKSFKLYYGHPWLAGKGLVRAMQCTQFCAKIPKNDLKPMDSLKRNFYFETEGVCGMKSPPPGDKLLANVNNYWIPMKCLFLQRVKYSYI